MRHIITLLILTFSTSASVLSQSSLLENVKRNPKEAMSLCAEFKALNQKGISVNSKEVIDDIAKKKNMSKTDAEILSIYVIGMNCPEIR